MFLKDKTISKCVPQMQTTDWIDEDKAILRQQ